jgi:hypothetical protein
LSSYGAPLEVAADHQLLDQKPRHDGLAGTWIVGEQKPQRLPGQHRLVDGVDLVRQRFDVRRVDRQQRIEQVGQADALCFRDQPNERSVAIEAPGPTLLDDLQARFVVAAYQLIRNPSGRIFVRQLQRL